MHKCFFSRISSFLISFPAFLFPSLSVFLSHCFGFFLCLFLSLSFFLSLSLLLFLSPHRVFSGRLGLTCSPVHQQICCSNQLSSALKPVSNTLTLSKTKRQTIPSREGKTTHKTENTKIRRLLKKFRLTFYKKF